MNFSFEISSTSEEHFLAHPAPSQAVPDTFIPSTPPIFDTGRKGRARNTTKILYNWNRVEERKYINFLIRHRSLFDLTNEERKCVKINVIMGKAIKTRTAAQCHSHHQKMMIKFGTIEGIIKAHANLIKKRSVPRDMREFVSSISKPNQSELEERSAVDPHLEMYQHKSEPFWMQYVDLFGNSSPELFSHISFDF